MSADLEPFRRAVVKILNDRGKFFGLGLWLEGRRVITCAHVVARALGSDGLALSDVVPTGLVKVVTAVHEAGTADLGHASVRNGGWFPKQKFKTPGTISDIAVLELEESPLRALPPPPVSGLSLTGISFALLGAPTGYEDDLAPITGQVGQQSGSGRYVLRQDPGLTVKEGCSGGPVCDTDTGHVIGLVVQHDKSADVPFLIPAEHLRRALESTRMETAKATGSPLQALRNWVDRNFSFLDFGDQIKGFVDLYAGKSEEPMPFVGRANELEKLNEWLRASGCYYITGGAGRGKSALLLHFVDALLVEQTDLVLLFLPISIRFSTADELSGLRLLHHQLSSLFAELKFSGDAELKEGDYRGRIKTGWTYIGNRVGKRFLLVIDGADEATGGWIANNVLPRDQPSNLAVVIASRSLTDYEDIGQTVVPKFLSERLGPGGVDVVCTSALLAPLKKESVKEALAQLGKPTAETAESDALLEELYRLTDQGDPLLLSLCVSQLWKSRNELPVKAVEQLRRMSPGLGGFLDRWFDEQEDLWRDLDLRLTRENFEPLLELFSLAQRPLTLADVSAIAHSLDLARVWEERGLRRTLESASRLLIQSGESGGFAFVHPRLGFHFRERLKRQPEQLCKVRHAFLAWGAETVNALNQGKLNPYECPSYLLHHYTWHIVDAQLPIEHALDKYLLPLVRDPGWHRAWYEVDGTYGGFLADLARIEDLLKVAPVRHLGAVLHCLLCRGSIRSLTATLPPWLIAYRIQSHRWSVARAMRSISSQSKPLQIDALLAVSSVAGEHRQEAVNRALELARTIDHETDCVIALAAVARAQAGVERRATLKLALDVAVELFNAFQGFGLPGGFDLGVGTPGVVTPLELIAGELSGEPDLIERARVCTYAIPDAGQRCRVLVDLASGLVGEERRAALGHALDDADTVEYDEYRANLLGEIAKHLRGERALLERAFEAARSIPEDQARAYALAGVAHALEGAQRAYALDLARKAAGKIRNRRAIIFTLTSIAGSLHGAQRRSTLERALEMIQDGKQADELEAVVKQLRGEPDLLARALDAVQMIGEERRRARVLSVVAEQLQNEPELFERLMDMTGAIDSVGDRAEVLAKVAQHWQGDPVLLERILVACETRTIGDIVERWRALSVIGLVLRGERRDHALAGAQKAALVIRDESKSIAELLAVAKALDGEERRMALACMLDVLEASPVDRLEGDMLTSVAGQLKGEPVLLERLLDLAPTRWHWDGYPDGFLRAIAELSGAYPDLLARLEEAAERVSGKQYRALAEIGTALERDPRRSLLARALDIALAQRTDREIATALGYVAQFLNGDAELRDRALAAAKNISDNWWRANALAGIASAYDGERRRKTMARALGALIACGLPSPRRSPVAADSNHARHSASMRDQYESYSAILVEISRGSYGHKDMLESLLNAAYAIPDCGRRAITLAGIGGFARGEQRRKVLDRALDAALESEEWNLAEVLIEVAPRLRGDKDLLDRALQAAGAIRSSGSRAQALSAIADALAGEQRRIVLLLAIDELEHAYRSEETLTRIALTAVTLEEDVQRKILNRVIGLWRNTDRPEMLKCIVALTPLISNIGGQNALWETAEAITKTAEWWP